VWVLAAVAGASWPSSARARDQPPAPEELAYRAKDVLRRHCSGCHGGQKAPRADLRVLDHALLLNDRKVITPGSPGSSELLTLVEVGSMPPGTRPKVPEKDLTDLRDWVRAGAPAFPADFGESYVLHKVVEDLRRLPPGERRQARYLSLNHLLENEKAAQHLATGREALAQVLTSLTPEGRRPILVPVDGPAGTLFRINLPDLGWDRRPYADDTGKEVALNLFDLALLEYPDCALATRSPLFAELSGFLRDMGQVRPVPYVRADWLVGVLCRGPLHDDLLKFLKALGRSPESTTLPTVTAFLDGVRAAGLAPKRPRDGDVPLVPLDGVTQPELNPAFPVEVKLVNYDAPDEAPKKFVVGDQIAVVVRAEQDAVIELVWDTDGVDRRVVRIGKTARVVRAGREALISPGDMGYKLDTASKDHIVLYAYPKELLDRAGRSFPDGKRLHARLGGGPTDRILHPVYQLSDDGRPADWLDLTKMVKRTVTLTILEKK
jgi:hypothetical protein